MQKQTDGIVCVRRHDVSMHRLADNYEAIELADSDGTVVAIVSLRVQSTLEKSKTSAK